MEVKIGTLMVHHDPEYVEISGPGYHMKLTENEMGVLCIRPLDGPIVSVTVHSTLEHLVQVEDSSVSQEV